MKKYNKKKIKLVLLFSVIFSITIGMITGDAEYKNDIKFCDNYIIYYGYKFNNSVMNKLKTYDLVVINPMEEDAEYVREELQNEGIRVYGYISSVEISKYDSEFIELIDDSEKLKVNNKIINYWEGNELGDFRIKSYRDKVIDLIESRIVENGYDGVFIDTIDDLDNIDYILKANKVSVPNINIYKNEMINAGVEFFKDLRKNYPELGVIQNRGFQVLKSGSKEFVNSILYEDIKKSSDVGFFNSVKIILDEFTQTYNGVVMALPNSTKYYDESRLIAEENKWLYYETTDYESTYLEDGGKYRIKIDENSEEIQQPDKDPSDDNSENEDKDDSSDDIINDSEDNDDDIKDPVIEDEVEDIMTEKERIVAEKNAVTKIKANLSPITRGRVHKDITNDEIIEMLLQDVQDKIVKLSIEDVVEKGTSRSFKIHVKKYLNDSVITIISAKIIYE